MAKPGIHEMWHLSKFDHEDQYQSISKTIGASTMVFYIFCPNLEEIASIGGDLSNGQPQNCIKFKVQFDIQVHGQLPCYAVRSLNRLIAVNMIKL